MPLDFDHPTEVAKRKAVYARMARLIQREKQEKEDEKKEEDNNVERSSGGKKYWPTAAEEIVHKANQLAYIEDHVAVYKNQPGSSNNIQGGDQFEGSSSVSTTTEKDTLPSLPSFRGQARRGRRGALSSPGSVNDFELASTALSHSDVPPERVPEDYTSPVNVNEYRRHYFSDYKTNEELPIFSSRKYLINSINSYSIVIIEGATGCGKTTQVPMYILEDAILDKRQENCPIIYVTQPRRIAAKSIANRVCDEHGWELGSIVGYQVGMEKMVSDKTVLVFCTAGVLLQKLIQDKSLKHYSHIIVDEAHERDADTDLLLMMIRALMHKEQSFFRLIVMSATIDLSKLKDYFTFRTSYGHRGMTTPAVCRIGQPRMPSTIQVIYYDKLRSTFQVNEPMPTFDSEMPEVHDECLNAAVKIIVDIIPHLDTYSEASKSTLVFLPGLAEICKLHRLLKQTESNIDILPLHSCLSFLDQAKVFAPARSGYRKVILATNIAESSITVKDAGFIIDFCLTKTLRKDDITRFPMLKLQWSTVDKSTQRAGRTGRCCPGKVFRMVSSNFFKTFAEYAEPELLTAPLELSVLRVKNFQMGEIKALFALVLDPPPLNEIRTAVLELKQIGALTSTFNGKIFDLDGDLTELGRVISNLPIDVHLSKLIVIASIFDVLEDAIIVAACLSTNRTVVKHLYGNPLETYKSKLDWAHGSYSDLFVSLDVYKEFREYKDGKNKSQAWLDRFCRTRNLDERKLFEVAALVDELITRLDHVNIRLIEQPNRTRNRFEDELMLKVAFCASFYPNFFLTQEPEPREIKRALCGLDPTRTVILHSFPLDSVPLYRNQILQQFKSYGICDPRKVDYIADVSRALLVLNDDSEMEEDTSTLAALGNDDGVIEKITKIPKSIYLAIRAGESLAHKFMIREYKDEAVAERIRFYKEKRAQVEAVARNRLMPSWIKLVSGRPADNSRLINATEAEFIQITQSNYYIEISFNKTQDSLDRNELHMLELNEEEQRSKRIQTLNDLEEKHHHIFKSGYKTIRGPDSPVRIKFRSLLEKSKGYNVDIDPNSVNSILLNPDYEKTRRQMLVAASVNQSKRGRIMARDTTLMPNIRGLPTLMSLMFAQYYRLVYNEDLRCLAGAIFGIGWDENDKPIDKEYEVELNFDIHITKTDIELINKVRRYMSELIRFLDVANPGAPKFELQTKLRQIILTLIKRRRFPICEVPFSQVDWSSGKFVKDKHNVPKQHLDKLGVGEARAFLPLMEATKIYSEMDMVAAIRENLNLMESIANCEMKPSKEGIRCLLCGGGIGYFLLMHHKIVKHIEEDSHKEKLAEFKLFEELLNVEAGVSNISC